MEDVVAVEVRLENQERRYFMTWGRIQHAVDPRPLAELILRHASMFGLGGQPTAAEVCPTLQAARDAPYFFEALISFGRQTIPDGPDYASWRAGRAEAMARGEERRSSTWVKDQAGQTRPIGKLHDTTVG